MTVLEELKVYCEVEETEQFDPQLLQLANQGLAYLANNKIPVVPIDSDSDQTAFPEMGDFDYFIMLSWLSLHVLRLFDRTISSASNTTSNWIDKQMENLLYQLKIKYDNGGGGL